MQEERDKGERKGRENVEEGMRKGNDTEFWYQKSVSRSAPGRCLHGILFNTSLLLFKLG